MRLIASLVLLATAMALPAADGLNLDDLERAAQSNAGDAKRWSDRRERMRADFAKVTALAERLNPEQRTQAWQRFLTAYADKDPYDNGDEELRRQARAALGSAGQPVQPTSAEVRADPALLATVRADYERAKAADLLPGAVDAKRHAWEEFLAQHGADLTGTKAGDEMRRWARLRLDGLAQTPPVLMNRPLTVFPEFDIDQGTRISSVTEHGLAQRLGMRAGDTIIAAGQPPRDLVGDGDALYAYIARLQREADLRLVVIRGDAVIAMPASATPPVVRGPVPARSAQQVGLHCLEAPTALIVGAVDAGQLGECAGLDAGDRIVAVQGAPVATMAALDAAIASLAADAPLELDVVRAGVRYRLAMPAAGGAATWTVADPDAGWAPARPAAAPEAAIADAKPGAKPATDPPPEKKSVVLGVQVGPKDLRVAAVDASSLAARLGVAVGDVIMAAGDPPHALATTDELLAYLATCAGEADVRLVVTRQAQGATPSIVVLPTPPAARAARSAVPPLMGRDNRRTLGIVLVGESPVTVAAVRPGSVAEALGLAAGDSIEKLDEHPTPGVTVLKAMLERVDLVGQYVLQVRTAAGGTWTVSAPTPGGAARWTQLSAPKP